MLGNSTERTIQRCILFSLSENKHFSSCHLMVMKLCSHRTCKTNFVMGRRFPGKIDQKGPEGVISGTSDKGILLSHLKLA